MIMERRNLSSCFAAARMVPAVARQGQGLGRRHCPENRALVWRDGRNEENRYVVLLHTGRVFVLVGKVYRKVLSGRANRLCDLSRFLQRVLVLLVFSFVFSFLSRYAGLVNIYLTVVIFYISSLIQFASINL